MEHGHEEGLGQVVEVLPEGQHIVALPPRCCIDTAALHTRTEAADRAQVRQGKRLLHDTCKTEYCNIELKLFAFNSYLMMN